ncbi:MAG TPA: glycosyltransferase family 4 protein, partial [Croceibacterium sp.]|nr:glycosyltransferase family 4 protein [Croceibacterium sp.]
MSAPDSPETPAGLRVGYVLTHYPRLAQTFIAGEIDAVERAGVTVVPFAMNLPATSERAAPGAAERIARTTYLKPRMLPALGALAAQLLRHPVGVGRVVAMALASAGGSPARLVRRSAHLVQAAYVAREARRARLAYLHAQFGLAPATIAWLASALAAAAGQRVPFGFTIHGFHDFVDAAESRLDLKARDAAHVLCISDFTRSQLCLVTDPALWPRFHVARCGIDLAAFAYRRPPPLDGLPTALAVGRLSAEKGFDVLIEALAELKRLGAPQRLVLVGDGPLRGALEAAAASAGIADLVEFAGELPPAEVRARLERADLFCLPSFSEGLPISLMEAMAVGVPVVTTWIAGIPELAEAGVTALTVPPARADALARAMRELAG